MAPLWDTIIRKAWKSARKPSFYYVWSLPAAFIGWLGSKRLEMTALGADDSVSLTLLSGMLAILLFFYLAQSFLKAGLLGEFAHQQKPSRKRRDTPLILLKRSLGIESLVLLLSSLLGLCLVLPLLLAWRYNPHALGLLSGFAVVGALPVFCFLLGLRELLYLYATLSRIKAALALEAALSLLAKKFPQIMQLFFTAAFCLFVFTIMLNVAMLTSVPFWEKAWLQSAGTPLRNTLLIFAEAWFLIFWQAIWYHGFQLIAKLPEPEEKEGIETEEVATPAVS